MQSSVLALMASRGEIEAPDCAIFADTQAEPASVYEWLDWLESRLSFPLYRVTAGSLEEDDGHRRTSKKSGLRYVKTKAPYWAWSEGRAGGVVSRRCTLDYKIAPVRRKVRRLLGIYRKHTPPGTLCEMWLGISRDEAHRMKPSQIPWAIHRWPLIDLGMSRADCLRWAERAGMPEPPRSACVFCPFHSAKEWRRLQTEEPQEYARACAHEDKIRAAFSEWDQMLKAEDVFLQRLIPGVPLREIDWTAAMESEEPPAQLTLWGNECEGLCGI